MFFYIKFRNLDKKFDKEQKFEGIFAPSHGLQISTLEMLQTILHREHLKVLL